MNAVKILRADSYTTTWDYLEEVYKQFCKIVSEHGGKVTDRAFAYNHIRQQWVIAVFYESMFPEAIEEIEKWRIPEIPTMLTRIKQ
jgi:hypothetical protein